MTDRFLICLPYTLKEECPFPEDWSNPKNFSNDAHDPGGETMCGIIQREYSVWRKRQHLPVRNVRLITEEEGQAIYRESYWLPRCPTMAPGLDLCFFDSSVNEGPFEAIKILQFSLGVDIDGEWGPVTELALENHPDPDELIKTFTLRRKAVYREMNGFKYFGEDWLQRSDRIDVASIQMSGDSNELV